MIIAPPLNTRRLPLPWLPILFVLATTNVPPLIFRAPVKPLFPVRVSVPLPVSVRVPEPFRVPSISIVCPELSRVVRPACSPRGTPVTLCCSESSACPRPRVRRWCCWHHQAGAVVGDQFAAIERRRAAVGVGRRKRQCAPAGLRHRVRPAHPAGDGER